MIPQEATMKKVDKLAYEICGTMDAMRGESVPQRANKLIELIAPFQLDAYRQGMTDAAEIVDNVSGDYFVGDRGVVSQAILTARDAKK